MSFAKLMAEHSLLQGRHTALRAAVDAYDKASRDMQSFMNYYLTNGGDPAVIPAQWNELDNIRQEKYAAMLEATKRTL